MRRRPPGCSADVPAVGIGVGPEGLIAITEQQPSSDCEIHFPPERNASSQRRILAHRFEQGNEQFAKSYKDQRNQLQADQHERRPSKVAGL